MTPTPEALPLTAEMTEQENIEDCVRFSVAECAKPGASRIAQAVVALDRMLRAERRPRRRQHHHVTADEAQLYNDSYNLGDAAGYKRGRAGTDTLRAFLSESEKQKKALQATIAAEKSRAGLAQERVLHWIDKTNSAQSDNATLSAKLAVCVEAVADACASERKLRDEAKRIMSPDAERYAESAHSLANLKACILAMLDGTAAADLIERVGKQRAAQTDNLIRAHITEGRVELPPGGIGDAVIYGASLTLANGHVMRWGTGKLKDFELFVENAIRTTLPGVG